MGKIKIISQCVMVMNRTGVGSAYQRRTSREVGVEKGPSPLPDRAFGASKPVSRVLSFKTAIYLDVPLPTRSSHLLNAAGPACCVTTVLLRIEFTAMSSSQSSGGCLSPPFHPYHPLPVNDFDYFISLPINKAGIADILRRLRPRECQPH